LILPLAAELHFLVGHHSVLALSWFLFHQ